MRHLKCSSCAKEFPIIGMFGIGDSVMCEPCADRFVGEAHAKKHTPRVVRLLDPTICSRCKRDNGDTEFRLIGGAPFCPQCGEALYHYPFPLWLKGSFAALLALLVFALWREGPYFAAGRHLAQARRALDAQDYQAAATHFAPVLAVKPTEADVILLGAKADLMVGDVAGAYAFLQLREKFPESALFTEVSTQWTHATHALGQADSAGKLVTANRTSEALHLMRAAAREYPQSPALKLGTLALEGGDAYEHQDYDLFLAKSRAALALMPDQPRLLGGVASALACKFAVSGDSAFHREADQLLARAELLAAGSRDDQAAVQEYAERIRYRLRTRVIIDKGEYDRRFRAKAVSPK